MDSLRERFPEFSTSSQKDILTILQDNEDRSDVSLYSSQIEKILKELEQEISLEADDEFLHYLFEESGENFSSIMENGINHIVKNWGNWDLVVGYWPKEKTLDWTLAIWQPVSLDDFNLIIQDNHKEKIKNSTNNILVLLSLNKTGQKDALWRIEYSLFPRLLDVSQSASFLPTWVAFKKDLTVQEFQQALEKTRQ